MTLAPGLSVSETTLQHCDQSGAFEGDESSKEENDDALITYGSEFLVGHCTLSNECTGKSSCSSIEIRDALTSVLAQAAPIGGSNNAYEECIRLLTRQLRRDQSGSSTKSIIGSIDAETCNDNWKEQYVAAASGIPELLTLQNTILQLQNALQLVQQEATEAIDDAAIANQACQHWKRKYNAVKQAMITVESENAILKQQNSTLTSEKRKLKASYKHLLAQHQLVQTQQVESYVISALANHEQLLQYNHLGSSFSTSVASKNRSRTTTVDTTGTTTGYDTLTNHDDPVTTTNSPNNCTIESATSYNCISQEQEVDALGISDNIAIDESSSSAPIKSCSIEQPPSVVTTTTRENLQVQKRGPISRGMNGFMGNACQALGKKLLLIDSNQSETNQTNNVHIHANSCSNSDTQNSSTTDAILNAERISPIPHLSSILYSPVRFDIITPTFSDDSNDSIKMHKQHQQKRHFCQQQSPPKKSCKPLIDVNSLLLDDKETLDAHGVIMNHRHIEDCNIYYSNRPTHDQLMLSLPIIPNPSSLKSESPLSIPEEDDEESTLYDSTEHGGETSFIQVERYSCDPAILRSLSIPTMSVSSQQQQQSRST